MSATSRSRSPQLFNWCFTINNYTDVTCPSWAWHSSIFSMGGKSAPNAVLPICKATASSSSDCVDPSSPNSSPVPASSPLRVPCNIKSTISPSLPIKSKSIQTPSSWAHQLYPPTKGARLDATRPVIPFSLPTKPKRCQRRKLRRRTLHMSKRFAYSPITAMCPALVPPRSCISMALLVMGKPPPPVSPAWTLGLPAGPSCQELSGGPVTIKKM